MPLGASRFSVGGHALKVVILAGGRGTRLAEETELVPKPMVEVGGRPLLWHIMKHFGAAGISEFVIPVGYRGEVIKRYFRDSALLSGSLTVDLAEGAISPADPDRERWLVHLVDSGEETNTGGRVRRVADWLKPDEPFMLTYGDGIADVDLKALFSFHQKHGRAATLTAVRPPARFGGLVFRDDETVLFTEKPQTGEGWINGGFMVLEPSLLARIGSDASSLEHDVLEPLSEEGQLVAFKHEGFWQGVDTVRDLRYLRAQWEQRTAPWVTWT